MTRSEFETLKVGDIVAPKQGYDKGIKCIVRYIEDDTVLFKILEGEFDARATHSNRTFRIASWRMLDLIKD